MNASAPKICMLSTVHASYDLRLYYKESLTLAAAGYDVTLILRNEKNEIREGVKVIALPPSKNRLQRMIGSSFSIFHLGFRQKADVYHFHDPELMPIGLLLKIVTGKKIIYDVHEDLAKDIMHKDWIPPPLRKILSWVARAVESLSSRFFDAVVTATDDIRENFQNHRRSVAVRNFPVLNFPELPPRENNGCLRIIYAGVLAPERGISEIIRALEFLDGSEKVRLVLYGEFSPRSFEAVLQQLPGFAFTKLIAGANPKVARMEMGKADIGMLCLHPLDSFITSMPNKFFEYMIAGLPLICSDFPLWRGIVEENRCGLAVNPLDPKEIAAAIAFLMKNPDVRKEMGANAKRIVLEKFNWEKESANLLRVYHELLPLKNR